MTCSEENEKLFCQQLKKAFAEKKICQLWSKDLDRFCYFLLDQKNNLSKSVLKQFKLAFDDLHSNFRLLEKQVDQM